MSNVILSNVDWDLLHPVARGQFIALANDLAQSFALKMTRTLFLPYEGYRGPAYQREVFKRGTSKARPWQSAHQYGLAVDFVPKVAGKWSWSLSEDWDFLHRCAVARGLLHEISWDKPHVEHPRFRGLMDDLRPTLGVVA